MTYEWLNDYLLAKPGAVYDYKAEWEAERYLLRGKMFAMRGGDKAGKPIVTFKLEPAHGDFLRGQYPDIIPGYYMNKTHWNSVCLAGDVPDDVMRQMADESYRLIFSSLSKTAQRELERESKA